MVPKPNVQWTSENERVANANSKALYVIFHGIDMQEFKCQRSESLKIDKLIRSLQTFKLNLDKPKKFKFKGERSIAIQVADEEIKKFETPKSTLKNKIKSVAVKEDNEKEKKKRIHCLECLGYGHIQKKCANTLKKKKKVLCASLSDEDTSRNSESNEEQVNNIVAFTLSVMSGFEVETDNDSDRGSDREFLNTYKTILSRWEHVCKLRFL
ncbi:hypothetical protein Goshw_004457 [Gossypium schwendimanii]|uniref:CCHC-type domain-containing protein n=1 Tax=Gossypium schwendimanii TaxID=34291 RepID=A0A7J9LU20_GOSSC|nr:hypothetical protein [Gossypium schwendimanii]